MFIKLKTHTQKKVTDETPTRVTKPQRTVLRTHQNEITYWLDFSKQFEISESRHAPPPPPHPPPPDPPTHTHTQEENILYFVFHYIILCTLFFYSVHSFVVYKHQNA